MPEIYLIIGANVEKLPPTSLGSNELKSIRCVSWGHGRHIRNFRAGVRYSGQL